MQQAAGRERRWYEKEASDTASGTVGVTSTNHGNSDVASRTAGNEGRSDPTSRVVGERKIRAILCDCALDAEVIY
jgi:hypothetical protein